MSHLPPTWVTIWVVFTTLVVTWDAGFGTLSPASRDPNHPIFGTLYNPYQQTYQHLDMFYSSDEVYARQVGGFNAFGPSQTVMNIVEIAVQLVYLWLVFVAASPLAAVVGLCVSVATFSKTVLYFIMLYFHGYEKMLVGTNFQRVTLFLIPNGIWSECFFAGFSPGVFFFNLCAPLIMHHTTFTKPNHVPFQLLSPFVSFLHLGPSWEGPRLPPLLGGSRRGNKKEQENNNKGTVQCTKYSSHSPGVTHCC